MAIENSEVESLIKAAMPNADVVVEGDGYKYTATVISDDFEGLMTIKRHQMVYAAVDTAITSGALHALTLITKTKDEV